MYYQFYLRSETIAALGEGANAQRAALLAGEQQAFVKWKSSQPSDIRVQAEPFGRLLDNALAHAKGHLHTESSIGEINQLLSDGVAIKSALKYAPSTNRIFAR